MLFEPILEQPKQVEKIMMMTMIGDDADSYNDDSYDNDDEHKSNDDSNNNDDDESYDNDVIHKYLR